MDKTELLALADRLQTQYEKRELPSWDEIHVAASALRRLAAAEPGEPGAWRYELSSAIGPSGNYLGWRWYLTETKPNVPEGSIRNLTPLYTRPQPAPAFGEGVEIKPLGWRGPISAYPTTIWEAKTPFGHYVIEEVSASDSPAYEVRFAGSLVSVKDDVNDAKDAAQTDYEKRVRSSVSTISVDESVDRVLSELRDRRLLNDVDDDLHQEIAIALIKAVWPLTQLRAPDAPQADQNADRMRELITSVADAGRRGISHVGYANYAERETEAGRRS